MTEPDPLRPALVSLTNRIGSAVLTLTQARHSAGTLAKDAQLKPEERRALEGISATLDGLVGAVEGLRIRAQRIVEGRWPIETGGSDHEDP